MQIVTDNSESIDESELNILATGISIIVILGSLVLFFVYGLPIITMVKNNFNQNPYTTGISTAIQPEASAKTP